MLAGPECPETQDILIPAAGLETAPCPYHKNGEFVLPPAMEWYYKPHHPEYTGARKTRQEKAIEFIYPASGSTLTLPRQLNGQVEGTWTTRTSGKPASSISSAWPPLPGSTPSRW